MDYNFSYVFTILFMLFGPIKLILPFAALTQGADGRFKRDVAIRGAVIASALCAFVALAGGTLLGRYRISLDALYISGGLVLLIAALQVIFQKAHPPAPSSGKTTAIQLAASPVAAPIIVTPAGVAVLLACTLLARQNPGLMQSVAICLAIMMVLNFLAMYFVDRVMRTPGLIMILTVLGAALLFLQVGLAIEFILDALKNLGAFKV